MDITTQTALVTGANRGLGRYFVSELLNRGVAKVYATSRRPEPSTDPRVVSLPLDVTDEPAIEDLARVAPDVTLLINNAGVATLSSFLGGDLTDARQEIEEKYWRSLDTNRADSTIH